MALSKELGRIGQRQFGGVIYEEFLPELRGKRGIAVYNEMSENDDIVGAILFAIEMLIRQCSWNVEAVEEQEKIKRQQILLKAVWMICKTHGLIPYLKSFLF